MKKPKIISVIFLIYLIFVAKGSVIFCNSYTSNKISSLMEASDLWCQSKDLFIKTNECYITIKKDSNNLPINPLWAIGVRGIVKDMIRLDAVSSKIILPEASNSIEPNDHIRENKIDEFYIGKFAISVAQFKLFVELESHETDAETTGHSIILKKGKWINMEGINWRHDAEGRLLKESDYHLPVVHLSWYDAVAFCKWLQEYTGINFRLPTNAEWQFASAVANHNININFKNDSSNVLNSSNLIEWCEDWYDVLPIIDNIDEGEFINSPSFFRSLPQDGLPAGAQGCIIENNFYPAPDFRSFEMGFRVALSK